VQIMGRTEAIGECQAHGCDALMGRGSVGVAGVEGWIEGSNEMATLFAMHVGRSRGSRGMPVGRIAIRMMLLGLILAWVAPAAYASEIVDLRIGSHADFTRVVFELDSPAGYRIERSSPSPGEWELVVSIDASSIPRKVQSDEALIGLVKITPRGNRAVAQIQLRKDGLSLKEMILANPPRIVLDVLAPATVRKKTAPKTIAKAAPVSKPIVEPAPKPRAEPPPAPAPAPKPVAKVETPARVAKAVVKPESRPEPTREQAAPETRTSAAAWGGEQTSADTQPKVVPGTRPTRKPAAAPAAVGEPSEGGVATMGVETPAARPPAPRKVVAKPTPRARLAETDEGMGMTTILAGIVGLIVLAFGALYLRRRGAGEVEADEGQVVGGGDDNPFSGLASSDASQPELRGGEHTGGTPGEVEIGGLEDDPDRKEEPVAASRIEQTSLELDGEQTAVSGIAQPSTQAAGGAEGDEEVMRIMREFERRIASLEGRLDEVSDARERLERQVAAQTEELRVQRAAIARTQRAVRNMSRPEEDGPTEPALRDPQ
jgi:hypothetical protein